MGNSFKAIAIAAILILCLFMAPQAGAFLKDSIKEAAGQSSSESTLQGVVLGENGVQVEQSSTNQLFDEDSEPKAFFESETQVRLVLPQSSTCPLNFTGISIENDKIVLPTRAGLTESDECSDTWSMTEFIIKSKTPLESASVELVYPDGKNKLTLPLERSRDGSSRFSINDKDSTLVWGEYSLKEVTSNLYIHDSELLAFSKKSEFPAVMLADEGKRVLLGLGGSSTCPYSFDSLNILEKELQLVSVVQSSQPCSRDYRVQLFELSGPELDKLTTVRIQPQADPQNEFSLAID